MPRYDPAAVSVIIVLEGNLVIHDPVFSLSTAGGPGDRVRYYQRYGSGGVCRDTGLRQEWGTAT